MTGQEPKIQAFLSRGVYMTGQTIYGSIRLSPKVQSFQSVKVFMVGTVRVSCSRWHPMTLDELTKFYGECHPMLSEFLKDNDLNVINVRNSAIPKAGAFSNDATACFFATNVVDILKRKYECYQDTDGESESVKSGTNYDNCCTFEVELPWDLPHSMNGRSCSYSYACYIYASINSNEKIQCRIPITILSSFSRSIDNVDKLGEVPNISCSSGRIKVGQIMPSRKWGLPLHITDEVFMQRTSVYALSSSYEDINSNATLFMRIANSRGTSICILKVFSEETKTIALGSRLYLKFDFSDASISCRRICVCLLSEEIAYFENSEVIAKSVVYDPQVHSIHKELNSIGLSLLLPSDCECTMKTDLLEISLKLKLELVVDISDYDKKGKFETLNMEVPFKAVHSFPDREATDDAGDQREERNCDLICLTKRIKECVGYIPAQSPI